MRVVVNRKTWLRGEGPALSYLLRPSDRKMCCLGSVCLAIGYDDDDIRGIKTIKSVAVRHGWNQPAIALHARHEGEMATIAHLMMNANDDDTLSDPLRERELTRLAALAGIELEFSDA